MMLRRAALGIVIVADPDGGTPRVHVQGSECAIHLKDDHVTADETLTPEYQKGDVIQAIEIVQKKQDRL